MKNKKNKIIFVIALLLILVVVGFYLFMQYRSYEKVEFTTMYENNSKDNANFVRCLEGVLRYGRDGIALLTENGTEVWNQSCQMNNPMVEMCGESIAVGDKGGTSILVFQKKGLKGEFKTPKTIEKFAVSSQGVVSAILKDEEAPRVICYDAVGKKLVEHTITPKKMGYPVDIALSEDGYTLIVSYLHTKGNEVTTKIAYYYFGDEYTTKEDYLVCEKEYGNTIIPVTSFMKKDISLLVADNALIFYKGLKEPKEAAKVQLNTEIKSVAYSKDYVAVIVQGSGSAQYEMMVYNTKGKMLCSVEIDKEYAGIKVVGNQIVLFDGQNCSIYLKNGVHRYEGNMEQRIMEIYPKGSMNKYMVINTGGFYEAQLVE